MSLSRRGLLAGIIAAACAPAVARAGLIMPIKPSLVLSGPRNIQISGVAGMLFTLTGTDAYGNEVTEVLKMTGGLVMSEHVYRVAPALSVMHLGIPRETVSSMRLPITAENQFDRLLPAAHDIGVSYDMSDKQECAFNVTHGHDVLLDERLSAGSSLIWCPT